MAVTGPRYKFGALLAIALAVSLPLRADPADDVGSQAVRAQVTYVASALASGNPTDALTPFDKSMNGYDKLSQYFDAITSSFDVVSEIEVLDEADGEQETTLKANWTLQIADRVNSASVRRTTEVTIHLKPIKGKWKIVSFTPIQMFNLQPDAAAK